jgi:hypothetical protein
MVEEAQSTAAGFSMDDNPRELHIRIVFRKNSMFYADLIPIANFRSGQDIMDKLHLYYKNSLGRFSHFMKTVVMKLKMRHIAIDVVSVSTVRLCNWCNALRDAQFCQYDHADIESATFPVAVRFARREFNPFLTNSFNGTEQLPTFAVTFLSRLFSDGPLVNGQCRNALYITSRLSQRLVIFWFVGALFICVCIGFGTGIVSRNLDIGLAIGSIAFAVVAALQALIVVASA